MNACNHKTHFVLCTLRMIRCENPENYNLTYCIIHLFLWPCTGQCKWIKSFFVHRYHQLPG